MTSLAPAVALHKLDKLLYLDDLLALFPFDAQQALGMRSVRVLDHYFKLRRFILLPIHKKIAAKWNWAGSLSRGATVSH
jgi:hypothetical protein